MKGYAIRASLLAATSLVTLAASAVQAQEAIPDPQTLEEPKNDDIVVVGTSAALANAEAVKRESNVIVDGISADDIGALPDATAADALIRIPGLTANDGTIGFGQVSIRGLGPDLTQTFFNGRVLPTTSAGDRRVGLDTLPTEGIGSAFVQKSPDASTIEGGLAGIVDIRSVKPFSARRKGFTLIGRGIFDDIGTQVHGPYGLNPVGVRVEASYIGKITDNLGLALSYGYLRFSNISPSVEFDTYRLATGARADANKDGVADAYPTNASSYVNFTNQNRHSILGTVQWRPTSSVTVTADGFYVIGEPTGGPIRALAVGAGGQTTAPTSATVTDNVVTQFAGTVGLQRVNYNFNSTHLRQGEAGLNIAFDNGGPMSFKIDASWARARSSGETRSASTENDAATAAAQVVNFSYDFRDRDNPVLNFQPLAANRYSLATITLSNNYTADTTKALRADFRYETQTPLVRSLEFGLRVDGRAKQNSPDGRSVSFATVAARPDLNDSFLAQTGNPFASVSKYLGGDGATVYPIYDVFKLLTLQNAPGAVINEQIPNDIASYALITETSYGLYGQANLEAGPLTGNVGFRWFITDEVVNGRSGTTYANAVSQKITNSYDYLLPAINLKYAATRSLAFRFATSKTMSRPVFQDLKIGTAVDLSTNTGGTVNISRGNPYLQPFTAKNVDLTAEWYPNRSTSLAIQGYYKWVNNFIVNQTISSSVVLGTGEVVPANIATSVNDPRTRRFRGFEVIARRNFDFLPGLFAKTGLQVNYTHNITDAQDDFASVQILTRNPTTGLNTVLTGTRATVTPNNFTRDLVNAQLYYSSKAVDFRVAYRWYSAYSRAVDNAYQSTPGGQLDLTTSVRFMKGFRFLGIIRNLNGAKNMEYIPDSRDLSSEAMFRKVVYNGREFTLGLRAEF